MVMDGERRGAIELRADHQNCLTVARYRCNDRSMLIKHATLSNSNNICAL